MSSPPVHTRTAASLLPTPHSPPPMPRHTPPEWPIETFIKSVGRLPRALGKTLDGLAKLRVIGPVVRLFSSVWFGISVLALIAAYVAIGSGLPRIRASLEMTDLQFFDAWPMRLLLTLLITDLAVVTLRRIPLTLFKLGSWTVHIGIVTLIGGAVWYFWHKQEGSVRIYLHQSVDYCYDVTERALYAFPVKSDGTFDTDHPEILPLPTLPIYYEHLAENRNPLDITLPPLAGTGVRVRITGYYPSAILQPADYRQASANEAGVGPGLAVALTVGRDHIPAHWLLGDSPAQRVLDGNFPFSMEYLVHPTAERLKDLQTSFAGPAALTVRVPKLNFEHTYAVVDDRPIIVEGTPYTLTPVGYKNMQLISKGYENAVSPMMSVDVERKDAQGTFKFQRWCIFRYPERSPDFVTQEGTQKRVQEGVDPDIQIIFHDASQTQMWIVQAADDTLSLITRTPDGASTTQPLADKPVTVTVPGLKMADGQVNIQVLERAANTKVVMKPEIVPENERPRGQSVMEVMQLSIVDVDVSQGNWTMPHVYVPFSPYAAIGDPPIGEHPALVKLPDGRQVGLLLATARRALPTTLTLQDFKAVKYPGAQRAYEDYISQLTAQDSTGTATRKLVAHLNDPAEDHGLYYFQSAWDGDDNAPPAKRFSVIGVGNRPGLPVMILGASLVILGVAFAFYIKPLLLKAKKDALARWAAARDVSGANL